jgi:hypothetical protein
MTTRWSTGSFLLATALLASAANAQSSQPLELSRLTAPIALDGMPDEPAWQQVPALPLTTYAPVFRAAPKQRSEMRVAYDDEFFYAAGWFYDNDPDGIRVNSLYRDRWNGDDAFAIYIDAFNDNQNAKWFGTTPAGMRFDQLVSDDGATLNGSWDTFWTSKTRVTPEGWFVEIRIPFSSLGFRTDADGNAVMGLTLTRLVSRSGERVTFPEIDPAFDFRRPSIARDVMMRGVRSRKPLYVTPYALTGVARRAIETTTPAGFRTDRETSRELGVDVRYPLSGNLTLDLTINTDFAQVEADDQQVNLDRFPLFFPERRRFFQEGSGIFDFVTGGGARLFHSRRIGLTPDFLPVPVLGGARLVGRIGPWDVGFLEMQTDKQGATPTENFGVLRLRRPVLNQFSTAGLMLTSYAGAGRRNLAGGVDGSLRLVGDEYLTVKWAGSADESDPSGISFASRSLFDAKWERRTERGLSYTISGSRIGPDYRPELGFLPRRDVTSVEAYGNWFVFTDDDPLMRRIYPGALAFSTFRNSDGVLESGTYAFWVEWDTKAGGGGWIEPKFFHEDVAEAFPIGRSAQIPAGRYDFADLQLALFMSSGARLRTSMDFRTGTYFDGTRTQVILKPTWNVSRHLELGADYQLSVLRFDDRDQKADIHVARLRIRTALDAQKSGNAFVQYNSTSGSLDVNLRLRYAIAEGTDVWLVYNEGLDTDRTRDLVGMPLSPFSLSRSLILKYTHTVGL